VGAMQALVLNEAMQIFTALDTIEATCVPHGE
jgi:hypothetical protein